MFYVNDRSNRERYKTVGNYHYVNKIVFTCVFLVGSENYIYVYNLKGFVLCTVFFFFFHLNVKSILTDLILTYL